MEQLNDADLQNISGGGAVGFFAGAILGAVVGGIAGGGSPFGIIAGGWGGGVLGSGAEDALTEEINQAISGSGGTGSSSGGSGPTVVVR